MKAREARYWPSWGPYEGVGPEQMWRPYAALARYVSVEAVERTPRLKIPRPTIGQASAQQDRALAEALYNRLAELRLDYAQDPKVPRTLGRQQVRDPAWLINAGWGTCLDLAVTYAAMCAAVGLAPFLVVGDGHALVALMPGLRHEGRRPIVLRGCVTDAGVQRVQSPGELAGPDGEPLFAVECTCAVTRGDAGQRGAVIPPSGFEDALLAGAAALRRPEIYIVDVAWLHENGFSPLPPPDSDLTVRLHLRGGLTGGDLSASQTAVLKSLGGKAGVRVIVAPPGHGKSTIARHAVAESTFGAGWFLGASDSLVLTNSLAEAELSQRNETGIGLSDVDRAGYAEAAVGRLREAQHPWVVVLDNADDDPAAMLRRLPAPSALLGQLIIVTTTNSAWAASCGYPVHHLEPLTSGEVSRELDNPELESFVGGRWLMVTAFKRLAAARGVKTSDIVIPSTIEPSAENGPGAFWAAATDALSDGDTRAARCAAFLPADNLRVDAVDAVHPGAAERLCGVGLIDHAEDEKLGRMHRLFRDEIQRELGDLPNTRDEVTLAITRNACACDNLAEYGDLPGVDAILTLLEDLDTRGTQGSGELGRAFHAIGCVLELRNHTKRSAESFKLARKHLDQVVPGERLLLAECLLGMARAKFQHGKTEEDSREGLAWADEAYQLMIDSGAEAQAGRFLAMRGLLKRKLAHRAGLDDEQAVQELRDALEVIEEANRLRQADGTTRAEELSRSAFNLAGPRIGLALRERARAAEHLDKARATYELVLGQRQTFYPHLDAHGHIAACIAGLATVDYLRAVLLQLAREERVRLLRLATVNAIDAMHQRQLLSGVDDNEDVGKSHRLLAKISMARHLTPVAGDAAATEHRKLLAEADDELRFGGFLV